ncbi:hypothetical protein A4H34_10205 [Peptidiphaga gingivicola]|uniref:ABC-2 type transporter domain-containing protein n=1 Tax=Peptidiphaga gingivicola TaxID=2741497 RepID=A0A179B312_9ACTO|nr:hypothetical protein [Peptidiphaga gingivicola]OAP85444.1 hypothetical protein A4H34_10205 [Peptidiphaga gingivicola]
MNVWTIAKIGVKETLRRPLAVFFVFLLPMVFYLVRLDVQWQAIRLLAIGVGWAVATLSLFSGVVSSQLDRRLCVMGARPSVLFAGRHIAQVAIGLTVSGVYFVVVAVTQDVVHLSAVGLLLVTTVLISVPLGALMSFAVAKELEGALALLSVMALQLLVDPDGSKAKLLPLWSTRKISAYAIGAEDAGALKAGMLHFLFVFALCALAAWGASVARLGIVRASGLPAAAQES